MFAINTRHWFPTILIAFWFEFLFLPNGRDLISISSYVYFSFFPRKTGTGPRHLCLRTNNHLISHRFMLWLLFCPQTRKLIWCLRQKVLLLQHYVLPNIYFKKILFIYSWETERSRDLGRGGSRLHAGSPMWDSILGLQVHDLNQRQILNLWATQVSLFFSIYDWRIYDSFLSPHSLNHWNSKTKINPFLWPSALSSHP